MVEPGAFFEVADGQLLDGVAADNVDMRDEGIARRTIRDVIALYDIPDTLPLDD
jgi:hypothetical protein